jgi:hypothetical protein
LEPVRRRRVVASRDDVAAVVLGCVATADELDGGAQLVDTAVSSQVFAPAADYWS